MDRRDFIKTAGGSIVLAAASSYAFQFLTAPSAAWTKIGDQDTGRRWGMLIDLTKCREDCDACLHACRYENNVAYFGDKRWDVHWIRKISVESEIGHHSTSKSVILLCNHCENPPCAQVCPVQATYKRHDGIVIVDHHRCIGCRYCMIACPYNARYFNFKDGEEWHNESQPKRSHGVAEACNLCAHRLDEGKLPACVEKCNEIGVGALIVGDLNDSNSEICKLITTRGVKRLKEDLGTDPKVYYIGL